jgi:hypothetical protein
MEAVEAAPVIELPQRGTPRAEGSHMVISTLAAERWGLDGQRVALVRVGEG